ncbi:hypothetical protein ACFPK9_14895 [Rubritalea spongiae]|uniref:Uncharacterized protein n=1 Tax=Rubritalea spongiae TaxID=430797 RepID=A0ABW5DZ36_9BACT
MKAKLPLKSLIGGVLVATSAIVCALAYMQEEASSGTPPDPPVIVENEGAI